MHFYHYYPKQKLLLLFFYAAFLFTGISNSFAYTVTGLSATCQNGQVFLTWTTPNVTNLQYNVYRSISKFTAASQLNASTLMGFVRDSSSKNIFWTQQSGTDVFFKIQDNAAPLTADKGLYVVTCTDNQNYFYAVTVTKLSNSVEDQTIVDGQNNLTTSLAETVAKPEPVWQDSIIVADGEIKQHYVQYGNNQDTPLYPAMNSLGSYGFNFFVVKRGNASSYALFINFEGFGADANKGVSLDSTYTNCYIVGVYDWLPVPANNGTDGANTYFCCYHQNFNIYTDNQPIPTSGVIRTYPQNRYHENIKWMESHFPIDTTRLYLKGTSANGFGAILTAMIIPDQVAAVYGQVEPTDLNPSSKVTKEMWGEGSSKLNSDLIRWDTGDTLTFSKLTHFHQILNINELRNVPPVYDVHGKNDVTVTWSDSRIEIFDTLEANHYGGAWYWDQRNHTGDGKNFATNETEPNYYRFATNKSYVAFEHCSVDQDPGNGNKKNGADYGGLNSYLDFDDNITDDVCKYSVGVFVKDLYVGGVLDATQYSTSTADITFRRLQTFHPAIGSTIKWKNLDVNGVKIQHGSFTYNGGLITLSGITINKTGNTIKLKISGCTSKLGDDDGDDDLANSPVYFSKSPNGYTAHVDLENNESADIQVFDLLGRMVWEKKADFTSGLNSVEIPKPTSGVFVVRVKGESFSQSEKLFF